MAARPAGEKGTAAMARQFGGGAGPSGGGRPRRGQTVYTLSASGLGDPKPVEIKPGITDGRFTQVADGALKEGDLVVTGLATAKADVAGSGSRPPGAPGGAPRRGF
jgi:multidrug efflux pump subunit AcrA (membrane-fusion protein)